MNINIKKLRTELGLSQMALAVKVEVSMVTIQSWERGLATPREENQIKLEKALGLR